MAVADGRQVIVATISVRLELCGTVLRASSMLEDFSSFDVADGMRELPRSPDMSRRMLNEWMNMTDLPNRFLT